MPRRGAQLIRRALPWPRNDHVLDLDDIVGPRLSLPAKFREARAHHLDGVERSGDRSASGRHKLALAMREGVSGGRTQTIVYKSIRPRWRS